MSIAILKNIIEKPSAGEWGDDDGLIKVLRTTNFTNEGRLDYSKVVTRKIDKKKVDEKKLVPGDIIIEKSGGSPTQPVGRVVFFDSPDIYLCNNFTAVLRPKKDKVFPKYLLYILYASHRFGLTAKFQNKTTGIINLQLGKYLDAIEIPLPPLPLQQKIAAILDAADSLRQKDKALVEKYNELTQALFLDMFGDPVSNPKGWEIKCLGDICGVGSSKRVFINELVDKGVPFYRGTEIGHMAERSGIEIEPTLFITTEHYNKLKKETGVPQIGDLLMPSICPDGRIFMVTNNNPFYFKDGRVLWIKVRASLVNSIYLQTLLKNIFYTNYTNIASGTTFAELKIFALKKINLLLPPISIQNQFAERVALIEKQKASAQASLVKSEELFNSLLQKAFKGELV